MENPKINAAIQLLPLSNNIDKYKIIDEAIALIISSGLNYVVCPFETVVEGSFEEVMQLIKNIKYSRANYNHYYVIIMINKYSQIVG